MSSNAIDFGALTGQKDTKAAPVDVDGFLNSAQQASTLISNSKDMLWKATANADDIAQLDAQRKAANDIADPKEKASKLQQIQASQDTQLAVALDDKSKQAQLTSAKGDKQKNINGAIYNFVLGSLKDTQLLGQGKDLVKGLAGNPANISKLGQVNGIVSSLAGQVDTMTKITGSITKLATTAKIELPKSAADVPKDTSI